MKECILDYWLADFTLSLDEVVEIIEFHTRALPLETRKEIKEDFKEAFSD